ncbi:MAG: MBL fold metallo-hydrolase [Bacteroidaceae bacterium]|nr:MBL fold metallo-hydrolase [Bacteroidaceae bacterium]
MKKGIIPTILLSLFAVAAQAQSDVNSRDLRGDIVYQDDEVVFRKLDDHTWIGNGHRLYNESLYLVEGNKSAVLIDAGVRIPELDKIVAKITSKPVTMILTHGHGDHVGGAGPFPEVWVSPADEQMFLSNLRGYQGKIVHLTDGQVIDLGDRKLEVMFTPGHTAGSVTFFDKANHYGFSGDAFGSTNLLVFTYLSNVVASAAKVEKYIKENNIKFLFPGHYSGDNLETPQRVTDIKEMCQEVLDGKRQPIKSDGNNGGNDLMIDDKGVRITFSSRSGIK